MTVTHNLALLLAGMGLGLFLRSAILWAERSTRNAPYDHEKEGL
jgi:hypothetical protein